MKANQLLVAAVFAFGASQAALAEDNYPYEASRSTLTRSEILADLQIYRESGLDALNRGDNTDPSSAAHTPAQAKYAQLRASTYYAALVQRIAAQRGETVILAQL